MVVRRRIRRVHWIAYGLLERVDAPVTRIRLLVVAAVVESHGEMARFAWFFAVKLLECNI